MRFRGLIIIAFALISFGVKAQTVITVTNAASAPEPDPANPDHYVYATQGSVRLNVHVTDGEGGLPLDMSDIQNTGSFRLEVFDVLDDYRLQNAANTTTPEVDVSQGEVRFNISSLGARTYEVKGTAIPATGTNEQYTIFWRYLTVTSAASAQTLTFDFKAITADSVTATNGTFDELTVGSLVVTQAISSADTGAVKLVGSVMQGNQDYAGLYAPTNVYDGSYTGTVATKEYVDNAASGVTGLAASADSAGVVAQVDGQNWTVGTNLTAVAGGLTYWTESFNTNNGIVGTEYYTTNDVTMGFRIGTNFSLTIGNITNTLTGLLSIDIQQSRLAGDYAAGAEQVVIGNQNDAGPAASYANIVGRANSANSIGVQIVGEGSTQSGAGADTVMFGNDGTSSGAARNVQVGKQFFSTGDDSITIGYLAYNQAENGGAIGRSVNNTNYEAMVISMEDSATWKASQADGSITLSFSGGLYVTATNTIMWRMSPSGVLYFQTNELDFVNHTLNGTSLL